MVRGKGRKWCHKSTAKETTSTSWLLCLCIRTVWLTDWLTVSLSYLVPSSQSEAFTTTKMPWEASEVLQGNTHTFIKTLKLRYRHQCYHLSLETLHLWWQCPVRVIHHTRKEWCTEALLRGKKRFKAMWMVNVSQVLFLMNVVSSLEHLNSLAVAGW